LRYKLSEGMRGGVGAEWETERELADPTLGFVLLTVGGSTLFFLGLTWLFEILMGIGWPLILVSVFLAVTLVQGPPSDIAAIASQKRNAPFLCAAWSARAMLILSLFLASSLTFSGGSVGWGPAALSVLILMPLVWLPLHQLRQFGLLALVGVLPAASLWSVGLITLSQAALLLVAFWLWFTGAASLGAALMTTIAAVAWLFAGNLLLTVLSVRGMKLERSD